MELVVATRNRKKLAEIRYMLKGLGFKVKSLADYKGLPRIVEDGTTFAQNAIKKSATIAQYLRKLTIGEDSGLEVKALGNRPGVYSSRYSGEGACDKKNNSKILRELKSVPLKQRQARYICSVAIADAHRLLGVFEGKCSGVITTKERGRAGFGYDPLFVVPEQGKTFAQLDPGLKNRISHRGRAFALAKELILGLKHSCDTMEKGDEECCG